MDPEILDDFGAFDPGTFGDFVTSGRNDGSVDGSEEILDGLAVIFGLTESEVLDFVGAGVLNSETKESVLVASESIDFGVADAGNVVTGGRRATDRPIGDGVGLRGGGLLATKLGVLLLGRPRFDVVTGRERDGVGWISTLDELKKLISEEAEDEDEDGAGVRDTVETEVVTD